MGFGQAIATVFKKYADFKGVATRSEYWWFALFIFLVGLPFQFLDIITQNTTDLSILLVMLVLAIIYLVFSLGTLVPSLAVTIRRLRDAGYYWPWIFIVFIPIAGAIILIVFLASPSKEAAVQPGQAPQPFQPAQPIQPIQSTQPADPTTIPPQNPPTPPATPLV